MLFGRLTPLRGVQLDSSFSQGLEALEIGVERIPVLENVNNKLKRLTGWQGVFVTGLEDGKSFFELLSRKLFPIGNFIRDQSDLSYTPAPDIFHDLYGHIPFLASQPYAKFCQEFGVAANLYGSDPIGMREFERFFWFTIEFGLLRAPGGLQVFGAGIASSFGECQYSLSQEVEVLPFDIERIRNCEFRIDVFQKQLFCLESKDQLFESIGLFTKPYR